MFQVFQIVLLMGSSDFWRFQQKKLFVSNFNSGSVGLRPQKNLIEPNPTHKDIEPNSTNRANSEYLEDSYASRRLPWLTGIENSFIWSNSDEFLFMSSHNALFPKLLYVPWCILLVITRFKSTSIFFKLFQNLQLKMGQFIPISFDY